MALETQLESVTRDLAELPVKPEHALALWSDEFEIVTARVENLEKWHKQTDGDVRTAVSDLRADFQARQQAQTDRLNDLEAYIEQQTSIQHSFMVKHVDSLVARLKVIEQRDKRDSAKAAPSGPVDERLDTDLLTPIDEHCLQNGAVCFVRLGGLKTSPFLNGAVGERGECIAEKQRWEVFIHGREQPALLKRRNLYRYNCHPEDLCPECGSTVNLNAFPPCECDLESNLDPDFGPSCARPCEASASASGDAV